MYYRGGMGEAGGTVEKASRVETTKTYYYYYFFCYPTIAGDSTNILLIFTLHDANAIDTYIYTLRRYSPYQSNVFSNAIMCCSIIMWRRRCFVGCGFDVALLDASLVRSMITFAWTVDRVRFCSTRPWRP